MSSSQAEVLNLAPDEYHQQHPGVSNSAKECFRESRELYKAQYIDKSIPWPEPTEAMLLGTAIHAAILEPDWFTANYVVRPKYDRRTTAGKADSAAWDAENGGKICIDLDSMQTVNAVREAAMANRIVRAIIEETPLEMREHTIAWLNEETGIECKSRRDIYHERLICDIKTIGVTLSAASVARRIASLGYHRQADFYTMGEQAFSGEKRVFVFLFLSTKPPYSVGLFDIDGDDLAFARKQNLETLAAMERCRRDPSQYKPDYAKGIFTVTLPGWAKHEDDWGF